MNADLKLTYGVLINSDVNFSEYHSGSGEPICEVTLERMKEPVPFSEWATKQSMLSSHGRELTLHSEGEFDEGRAGHWRAFEVKDVVVFSWKGGSTRIEYELDSQANEYLLAFWFFQILLPLYLSLEKGFDFLHAGSVLVDGRAVLFVARSMGGKSTLTEYFLRKGHPLVTDDKLATIVSGERLMAIPSHGNYRPYRRSEDLGKRASQWASAPAPVASIYLLNRVGPDDEVSITEIEGFRKFDRVMPNYILGFRHMRGKRLSYLAKLLNVVPVFEVAIPNVLERLEEVYEAVCCNVRQCD